MEDISQIQLQYEHVIAANEQEISRLKETIESLKQSTKDGLPPSNGFTQHDGIENSRSTPEIQVIEHSPPTAAQVNNKKKLKKAQRTLLEPSMTSSLKTPHRNSVGDISIKKSPLLISQTDHGQETHDDISIDMIPQRLSDETTTRRSFDSIKMTPRGSSDKLTITQMVEENFHKSGSMAAIRQQIKADGLTPKINRKFKRPLPTMPEEFIKTSDQHQKNILGNEN